MKIEAALRELQTKHGCHTVILYGRAGGMMGEFRRAELLPQILADFFSCRGEWYLGPKASFQWLEKNRPELFSAFKDALKSTATFEQIEKVALLVERAIDREKKFASPETP